MPDWILMLFCNHCLTFFPPFVDSWLVCLLTPWTLFSLKGYKDRSTHETPFPQEWHPVVRCSFRYPLNGFLQLFKKWKRTQMKLEEFYMGVHLSFFLSFADKIFLKGTCSWWSSWVFSPWSLLQCVLAYSISTLLLVRVDKGWPVTLVQCFPNFLWENYVDDFVPYLLFVD